MRIPSVDTGSRIDDAALLEEPGPGRLPACLYRSDRTRVSIHGVATAPSGSVSIGWTAVSGPPNARETRQGQVSCGIRADGAALPRDGW